LRVRIKQPRRIGHWRSLSDVVEQLVRDLERRMAQRRRPATQRRRSRRRRAQQREKAKQINPRLTGISEEIILCVLTFALLVKVLTSSPCAACSSRLRRRDEPDQCAMASCMAWN
jgi:hypothetical protein